MGGLWRRESVGVMLHWLLKDFSVFGVHAQNWVWVLPGIALLYGAILVFVRSHHADTRL